MKNLKQHILTFIVLLIMGVAAYSNSFPNPFILDDHLLLTPLVKNPSLLLENFKPHNQPFSYRPMLQVFLTAYYALFGDNPWGYHAANMVLLAVGSFLFYMLLYQLCRQYFLSLLAGLFFMLHPLNSTLVNHITTVNMLAQNIFCLLGLILIWNNKHWIWSCLCLLAALLSHENAFVLPLYAVLMLWAAGQREVKGLLRRTWALWALTAAFFMIRTRVASLHSNVFDHYAQFNMSFFEYTATMAQLFVWYIQQLFMPTQVVFTWGIPVERTNVLGWNAVLLLAMGIILFLCVRFRNSMILWLSLIWSCVSLGLVFFGALTKPWWFLMIEPYWLTFAMLGFCMFLALIITHAKWRLFWMSIILICWIWTNRIYNTIWTDEKVYSHYSLLCFPGYNEMHWKLARAYEREGNWVMADMHNQQVLSNHPQDQFNFYVSQGSLKIKQGQFQQAKMLLTKAYDMSPRSANVLSSLAIIALSENNRILAKDLFHQALQANSKDSVSLLNLSSMARQEHDYRRALQYSEQILSFDARNENAMAEMIQAYIALKDKEGIIRLSKMILSYSKNPLYIQNARMLLQNMGITYGQ